MWVFARGSSIVGLIALLLAAGAAAAAPPRRIVSLNPCLDAVLLRVADAGQVKALSHYSRDPRQSLIAAEARRFSTTDGTTEEVLALKPDLVLDTRFAHPNLPRWLDQRGVHHRELAVPATVEANRAQIREIAQAVGRVDRGEVLVREIDNALARARPPAGSVPISAIFLSGGGQVDAAGTLNDALLGLAGFRNWASRYGLTHTGDVDMEALLANPPQVIFAARTPPGQPAWADRVLHHPAFARLERKTRVVRFDEPLLYCGGPNLIPTLDMLARARRKAAP
jgi:iron complex transport system substrate-binding protein